MLRATDLYFMEKEEPVKGCLLALRQLILESHEEMSEAWKYGMPFYCIRGKMCCYLWVHKKYRQPYIGFVEGALLHDPGLLQEKRARMKILLVDAAEDLPLEKISGLLQQMLAVKAK